MEYGVRFKKLRESKKLSQQQLADALNINRSTYARYELGKTQPDFETLEKIADFFGVSTDYLIGRTDEQGIKTVNSKNGYKFSEKDERDIAKRVDQIKKELLEANSSNGNDQLNFYGEPMSDEAIESFLESMELLIRQTKRINKKYVPKKYRKENE